MVAGGQDIGASAVVCLGYPLKVNLYVHNSNACYAVISFSSTAFSFKIISDKWQVF